MSSIPYETATSGDRALVELQRALEKFGCQSFGTMVDNEKQVLIVAFRWRSRQVHMEASWKGYAAAWQRVHPKGRNTSRQDYDVKALAIGRMAVCSVLRDWVKAQTTAIECGVMSFDAVFMPHMLLPSGERLIDRIEAEKLLPPPNEKVIELKP